MKPLVIFSLSLLPTVLWAADTGVGIYPDNPLYWQFDGKPTMLIGGSSDDNLFQVENVAEELALLQSVGGNYVRCTMSSRDECNEKPYVKNSEGLYDLEEPNPRYWARLAEFLREAEKRQIVVQIELWATYDFYWGKGNWDDNPFNPARNVNYSAAESGLPAEIDHPAQTRCNPFFLSVPDLEDMGLLLRYQQSFVDRICAITFRHRNVLYTVDNETNTPYQWGRYWARYLQRAAKSAGRVIAVTEMWDSWDPSNGVVPGAIVQNKRIDDWFEKHFNPRLHDHSGFRFSLADTDSYSFLDVSNHNSQKGETHYLTALWVHDIVRRSSPRVRPINNVKIYGGYRDRIWAGGIEDGIERFWRNLFAGHAAVRFHRPPAGIGLNDIAQREIKRMRQVVDSVNLFGMAPRNDLLSGRSPNEAFCMASPDHDEILIYFPRRGQVTLDVNPGLYRTTVFSDDEREADRMLALPQTVSNDTDEPRVVCLLRVAK